MTKATRTITPETIEAEDIPALLASMKEIAEADVFSPAGVAGFNARDSLGVALRDRTARYLVSFEKQGKGGVFQVRVTTNGTRRYFAK
jgi:hypothetical protein